MGLMKSHLEDDWITCDKARTCAEILLRQLGSHFPLYQMRACVFFAFRQAQDMPLFLGLVILLAQGLLLVLRNTKDLMGRYPSQCVGHFRSLCRGERSWCESLSASDPPTAQGYKGFSLPVCRNLCEGVP